ncbi:Protein CBG18412 [Caenorhabditis briggsae]|uniref:Protein CBG18412 n=1 Tax=Caenorhabditis briggsae TaxID=6238 RepID=A8XT95_CAEBR|nr:Protein CBG18412 [Caenorhabditis briggsae]CAP35872.2 Protein CBG18412 [Caenorhabditis briggsae]
MQNFEYSLIISKIAFFTAIFTNNFLIYLTLFHTKKIDNTYKKMIAFLNFIGQIFSGSELIAQPFMHNFNSSIVFFSFRTTVSQKFMQFTLAFYAGFVGLIISLMAIQFFYRFLALFHSKISKKFEGKGIVIWIIYPWIPWFIYFISLYLFCQTDDFADSYVRAEMFSSHGLEISNVPRFISVSYVSFQISRYILPKNDRIKEFSKISKTHISEFGWIASLEKSVFPGTSRIYPGLSLFDNCTFCNQNAFSIKKETFRVLDNIFSTSESNISCINSSNFNSNIHFHPSSWSHLFWSPFITDFRFSDSPKIRMVIKFPDGYKIRMVIKLNQIFSVYPAIDSIVFMMVVSEYSRIIKSRIIGIFSTSSPIPTHSSTINVRVSPV